jgi:hypothetical protein
VVLKKAIGGSALRAPLRAAVARRAASELYLCGPVEAVPFRFYADGEEIRGYRKIQGLVDFGVLLKLYVVGGGNYARF